MENRRRLALAVLLSILLHGLMLAQRGLKPREIERPYRFSVVLHEAPRAQAPTTAPLTHIDLPEPAPPSKVLTRPSAPNVARPLQRPPELPAKQEPVPKAIEPPHAAPSGNELAGSALASVQGLTREMDKQERRLDPTRDHMNERVAAKSLNPVAIALEKQFGRPLPFHEESIEPQPDGSTLYRLRTELGSVCMKSMPPNVELAAPGQGLGHTLMVPMNCPGGGK